MVLHRRHDFFSINCKAFHALSYLQILLNMGGRISAIGHFITGKKIRIFVQTCNCSCFSFFTLNVFSEVCFSSWYLFARRTFWKRWGKGSREQKPGQVMFYILDYINKSLAKDRGYNIFHWHTVHTGHKVQNILRVKELSRYKCFHPFKHYSSLLW